MLAPWVARWAAPRENSSRPSVRAPLGAEKCWPAAAEAVSVGMSSSLLSCRGGLLATTSPSMHAARFTGAFTRFHRGFSTGADQGRGHRQSSPQRPGHPPLGGLDLRPWQAPRPAGPDERSAWRHNAAARDRSSPASSSISRPSCQPSRPTARARSRAACWAAPGGCCHPRPPIHPWPSAAGDPTGDHPGRHRYPALSWVFRSRSRGLQIRA
jgi:hypothetical protein